MFNKNEFIPPTRDKYAQPSAKEEMTYDIIFTVLSILIFGVMLYAMHKGN